MQKTPELESTFRLFDSNGDGKIDFAEFIEMSRSLGQTLSAEQARRRFSTIDIDGDGAVDLDEFVYWWSQNVDVVDIKYDDN